MNWDKGIKYLYFGYPDKNIVYDCIPIGLPIVILGTNYPGHDNSRLRFDEILDAHIKKMGLDEGRLSPNSLCTGKTETASALGLYAKATPVQLYRITKVVKESEFKSEEIKDGLPICSDHLIELSERGDKLLEVEHSTIEERMRPLRLVCRGSPIIVEYEDLGWSLEQGITDTRGFKARIKEIAASKGFSDFNAYAARYSDNGKALVQIYLALQKDKIVSETKH